ncbi:PREDICTED: uncharacterized protein LOC109150699 isoform X5 [Ipomoea nil]|uniref:uncharacterized protein LOC109150699 isoform X5 n=1 Tax=Ipomoea nil TaxID=35883 RepID=UPI000901DD56|nr:PREDICTED: uncharacterized protein LOC109150699 isoform X5 [Ipomoea nil]
MARFSGARGSRRRVAGQPVLPVTRPFKRRSGSGVLSASGIAARVAARRQAALQLDHSGADARQPIILSDDGTDVDDEAPTPPRDPEELDDTEPVHDIMSPFPQIETRGRPSELVRLLTGLSTKQRKDVISIGMGGLLGLRVKALPLRLGHWLVSNFNPAQMAIKLSNGRFLRITEEGVAAVLGLPNGSVTMTERDTHMVGPDLLAWRCKVKNRKGNITVHALATLALSLKEGGVWFKRHFCVVVASTLVASTLNSYANQKTVHMFKDVRMIKDLDWCGYLLSSLVNTHDSWTQNTARKFPGPLLFLTLFYVDRVEAGERNVPRANPAAHGWTKRALDAREQQEVDAGEFGYGQLEEPFSTSASRPRCRSSVEQTRYGRADSRPQPVHQGHTPGVSMVSAASRAPTVPSPQGDTTGSRGAAGDHPVHHGLIPDANKGFGCELDSMIADLRTVASRVADKVREDPRQAQRRQCFHHLSGVASLILGLIPASVEVAPNRVPEVTTAPVLPPEHHEDPFWHSSQLFREVNRVEEAVTRDLATQRVVGMPVRQANGTMQSRQCTAGVGR